MGQYGPSSHGNQGIYGVEGNAESVTYGATRRASGSKSHLRHHNPFNNLA